MTGFRVSWSQHVHVSAIVDVELAELATWLTATSSVRTLQGPSPTTAEPAELLSQLETNQAFRDAALRLWALHHQIP